MKNFLVIFSLLSLSVSMKAQEAAYALIAVHADPSSPTEFRQKIYAYHFMNGHFTGREELLVVKGKSGGKDYIRTDLGTNQLYKNRYLITGIGNIIDLKEKKVLFDQRANLVRCSNDSAIYYTNDAFKGKFYSVYDFKTNQYGEVKKLTFKTGQGQDLEFDKSAYPYKLYLYPQDKPKVLLASDAGNGQTITGDGPKKPDPSIHWLDNNNFIYPKFNKENTEITFVKINAVTKATTVIGKGVIKAQSEPGSFTSVSKTEAVYNFGDKKFSVDAGKNLVTDLTFTKPENGFSVECKTNPYGHIIKYNDKEVGKYHFQLKNLKTEKEIAAIVKELKIGEDSYQQGMSVWNNSKQIWESVDSEDVLTLVGWIREN